MSDEILINACESDEVVIYDEEGSEELLLSAEGIVIVSADAPVESVNGKAGVVVLTAADVGADPAGTAAAVGAGKANTVHGHVASDVAGLLVALAQVEANRLAILSKADKTTLDALALLVDTKADASDVAQQIADLVGTDAQVLAAITALGEALAEDQDLLDALEYTVANRVRFDVNNQSLTSLQKANARTNIGAEEIGVAALLVAQVTAASIGAATAAQGAKADTALQTIDAPAAVRDTPMTSLSTATAMPVLSTDLLIVAVGKLQAQISSMPRKFAVGFWSNQYASGAATNTVFASSSTFFSFFVLTRPTTISKIGVAFNVNESGRQVRIRYYDFLTRQAVSPVYQFAAEVLSPVPELTLPSPLTLPAGVYLVGYQNTGTTASTQQMRSLPTASCLQMPTALQVGLGMTGLSVASDFASSLPASVPLDAADYAGGQAIINFFVTA